ncbi:response regulator [Algimonas porphyrae]|uniref:Response regulatory domain-containing protein n=1 Tax=Algimonas porphyrae TaxID=1128113 RepID=A0ABQ5V277_9PROT|nr:response regulator [Algimonas porphyrae]GLQ20948.1 hypothetical protein GCM10007854_19030 [Algimonas porphyrae]
MSDSDPKFCVLLIDDDPFEARTVNRIFGALTDAPFYIAYVQKCSEAIALLDHRRFDLVLLDNRLSERISARFSVPIIKAAIGRAPLAIISSDTSPTYLQDPATLGVDFIVDKSEMITFLKSQLGGLLHGDGQPVPA